MSVKAKVLDEMIKMLGDEDGKMLSKHPKVMAAKLTVAKPVEKKVMEEEIPEMESEEMDELPEMDEELDLDSLPEDVKSKVLKMLSKC
jgi:hypothetical protein